MIDTHCHAIPYFDDGAEDWETALTMLQQAETDGIEQVVCTPHILSQNDFQRETELLSLFNELCQRAGDDGINVRLHLGSELYIQPDLPLNNSIATLAQNGRYFLMEFPMSSIPGHAAKRFFETLPDDKVAIIAHPERNGGILEDPELAVEFVKKGALLQVTGSSLLGRFGEDVQSLAERLMDANLVQIIATDAHDVSSRPLKLAQACALVAEKWGEQRAQILFRDNPERILQGRNIIRGEVGSLSPQKEPRKFWSFFKKS